MPYLGLVSPQTTFRGLKRKAWGAEGGSCQCWLHSLSSYAPTPGLASPSLQLWRKPVPQSQTSQDGWGGYRGCPPWEGWQQGLALELAPLALPDSQPPSGFHLKPGLDPLQSPLTKPGSESVDGNSHGGRLLSTYCVCRLLCVHSGPFAFMADLRPHLSLGSLEALESHFTDGKISPERTSHTGQ